MTSTGENPMNSPASKQARSRKTTAWTISAALAAVAAVPITIFGLHGSPAVANAPAAAPPATPVSVATVAQSQVAAWEEFSGRLEAVERVEIRSRAAGTVQALHFREGSLVKAGDLLATIDPAPYKAE